MSTMSDIVTFSKEIWSSYLELNRVSKVIVGGVVLASGLTIFGKQLGLLWLRITKPLRRKKGHEYKDGVLYLHIFPRRTALQTPNLSPFAVKLESWLRLKGLQHQVIETFEGSKVTQQIPYLIYNGKEYTDSNLIMEFLRKEKNLDASEGLSIEQRAAARGLGTMLDESFSMSYFLYRYVYNHKEFYQTTLRIGGPWLMRKVIEKRFPKTFLQRAIAQGIGRKDKESVIHIGNMDVKAVSDFLGDKLFLMGDEITTVDCCVFGHLSQVMYVDFRYPHKRYIEDNCKNLLPYLDRIKAKLWPDWNTLVKMS